MKAICAVILVLACFAVKAEEESAHDVILKVNEKALEEGLAFGALDQPPLIEGDIIDDDDTRYKMEQAANGGASAFDALQGGKWPNGVVPYTFGSVGNYARSQIKKAIEEYRKKTCIRFVPRTNQRDYVVFNAKGGCYSQIGRTGRGMQEISIGRGCESTGTVIHEMMHAIGFFHEQSRIDRDRYVKINWNNIQSNMKFNFNMYREGQAATYNEPYDKQSVMHYSSCNQEMVSRAKAHIFLKISGANNRKMTYLKLGWLWETDQKMKRLGYSFSTNRRPTIVSRTNENERLGNNVGFTAIDIKQINKHYGCSGGGPNPPPNPGPNPPPTDCKDISPTSRCERYKHKCGYNDYVAKRCQKTCGKC